MEPELKPVMVQILVNMGFLHSRDFETIVKPNCFDLLDDDLVKKAAKDYNLHDYQDIDLGFLNSETPVPGFRRNSERKFQIVNRILELKHGMIIDEIKEMDGRSEEGYDLELLPFGF